MAEYFELGKKDEKKEDKKEEKKEEKKENDNEEEDKKKKKVEEEKKNEPEDEEAEKLNDEDDVNKKQEKIVMERIEFDMSQKKKQLRMKAEDKAEAELIRRWQVKIYNIYITPLKEKIDPFVQFTIGGDYSIKVLTNKKGDTRKIAQGERGFAEKTEVIESIEVLSRAPFDKTIEIEMRMSYAMICQQKLMIEIWDYNSLFMNTILGYTTIDLLDVVTGDINFSFEISKKEGKKRAIPVCIIDFKCIFQEICDFKLTFLNWKSGPIVEVRKDRKEEPKSIRSQLKIHMDDKRIIDKFDTAWSDVSEVSTAPIWSEFEKDSVIIFRGSVKDLEQAEVTIYLYDVSNIFPIVLAKKTANLNGLLDFERIKTDFTLVNETGDKFNANVGGSVNIDHRIKYRQTGDLVSLMSKKSYLCINVMRVEGIRPVETRGTVDSSIQLEWGGKIQRTRVIKENLNPVFNETIYFEMPFPDEWLADPKSNIKKINEEFATKNEVVFSLMVEGDDNTYDNLGIGYFHLSMIKTKGDKTQRKYFSEDLKKDRVYGTRLYVGQTKLVSAFSLSTTTKVNFEAWFLNDFPDTIDFGEEKKKSEMGDKVPIEFAPYVKNKKNYFQDLYQFNLKQKMVQSLKKQKDRCYQESFIIVKDQFKNTHELPVYLSIITPPETVFSKEDIAKNKNFHDYNLRTLDEVAHYVHCINYAFDDKEVWVSPDFMLQTKKGDSAAHAVLCACLMMGLGEIEPETSDDGETKEKPKKSKYKTPTLGGTTPTSTAFPTPTPNLKTPTPNNNDLSTTTAGSKTTKEEFVDPKTEKNYHPYENRTFVCVGKLHTYGTPHIWVMTIDDEWKGVILWDPLIGKKYELQGRIDDGNRLRTFLSGKFPDYESVKENKISKDKDLAKVTEDVNDSNADDDSIIKQPQKLYEDRKNPGENDSFENEIAYKKDDKFEAGLYDYILEDQSYQARNNFMGAHKDISKIDKETYTQNIDDRILGYKGDKETGKKDFNFLDYAGDKIQNTLDANTSSFTPVENFRDNTGKMINDSHLNLPYETLDFIFNRNNIWVNLNNHDPRQMKYNIYDKDRWMPYYDLKDPQGKDKIWTGNFDAFYATPNFGPSFKPKMVNKMRDNIMKEIRMCVTAARDGMNIQTLFKKKNEDINDYLGRYCNFLEQRALNRITQKEFDHKKDEWEIMVKQKVPKYYRMEYVCVQFNSYELEFIRRQIVEDLEYFYSTKERKLMFATSAGVYPYLNGVVSVRVILAKFYKILEEDVIAEDYKDYKETLDQTNVVLEEEQDSDDEEEIHVPLKKVVIMTKLEDTPTPNNENKSGSPGEVDTGNTEGNTLIKDKNRL